MRRPVASAQTRARVRGFASDINDPAHQKAVELWTKISYGMVGLSGALTVVVGGIQLFGSHHHHHAPAYPYLKMRLKPYPWKISDCNLFDMDCKRKAKMAAKAAH
jgi:hypothetical protein